MKYKFFKFDICDDAGDTQHEIPPDAAAIPDSTGFPDSTDNASLGVFKITYIPGKDIGKRT